MRKSNSFSVVGFAVIYLLMLVSSCSEDQMELVETTGVPPQVDNQTLSGEERAIKAFEVFIDDLNKNPCTRSNLSHKVLKVDKKTTASYTGDKPTTRAFELSLPVYELTLESGSNTTGFAVVAECPNTSHIMAYAPMGSIADTTFNKGLASFFRDFAAYTEVMMEKEKAKTRTNFEFFQDYDIFNFVVSSRSEFVRNATPSEEAEDCPGFPYYQETKNEMVGQFVDAMWDQSAPYNNNVPYFVLDTNRRVRVGCFPVALGQLLSYYKTYPGYNWSLLTASPKIADNTRAAAEVSRLLSNIAADANTSYYTISDQGGTSPENIYETIYEYGFKRRVQSTFYDTSCRDTIYNNVKDNHPVLVQGRGSGAHIWIVDKMWTHEGWKYWAAKINSNYPPYEHGEIYRDLCRISHAHCNWGWGNLSDGWYYTFTPIFTDGKKYTFTRERVVYSQLFN